MGDWAIFVKGIGIHHNRKMEKDANRMAAKFVKELREAGHNVQFASFTHSGNDNIADQDYLEKRDQYEQ